MKIKKTLKGTPVSLQASDVCLQAIKKLTCLATNTEI